MYYYVYYYSVAEAFIIFDSICVLLHICVWSALCLAHVLVGGCMENCSDAWHFFCDSRCTLIDVIITFLFHLLKYSWPRGSPSFVWFYLLHLHSFKITFCQSVIDILLQMIDICGAGTSDSTAGVLTQTALPYRCMTPIDGFVGGDTHFWRCLLSGVRHIQVTHKAGNSSPRRRPAEAASMPRPRPVWPSQASVLKSVCAGEKFSLKAASTPWDIPSTHKSLRD